MEAGLPSTGKKPPSVVIEESRYVNGGFESFSRNFTRNLLGPTLKPDIRTNPVLIIKETPHLRVGQRIYAIWRDGTPRLAEIVEVRKTATTPSSSSGPPALSHRRSTSSYTEDCNDDDTELQSNPETFEFYCHYVGLDKRLDEWVKYDRLDISNSHNLSIEESSSTSSSSSCSSPPTRSRVRRRPSKVDLSTSSSSSSSAHLVQPQSSHKFRSNNTPVSSDLLPSSSHRQLTNIITNNNNGHSGINNGVAFNGGVRFMVALEREHETITRVKNIGSIMLGKFEIETWYFSPFPEEFWGNRLFICEYSLKYAKSKSTVDRHLKKLKVSCNGKLSPPGNEIYHQTSTSTSISVFEVDGAVHKVYCQNLCLLSKLFLDHKTLYYDVDAFLFYILCEVDVNNDDGNDNDGKQRKRARRGEDGDEEVEGAADVEIEARYHIVGYFSKEKQPIEQNNLACILIFPPYQRRGYGTFLISFSYELTRRQATVGAPEKPLSDLGKVSYRSYWSFAILNALNTSGSSTSIQSICKATAIRAEDVVSTLHNLGMIKFWRGQVVLCVSKSSLTHFTSSSVKKKMRVCDPSCLTWDASSSSSSSSGVALHSSSMDVGEIY